MFIPVWLIFLTTGLIMAIGTLIWSVKSNQFDDQQRARYIPLMNLTGEEMAQQPPIRRGFSLYALLFIIACGLLSIGMTISVMMHTFTAH